MGIERAKAEFVTDRCLCGKTFKGPDGRHQFNLHALRCEDQIALRVANSPQMPLPSKINMDSKTLDALENMSKSFQEAVKTMEKIKK